MRSFWEPATESQTNWYLAHLFIPVHILQKLSPTWLDVILKKILYLFEEKKKGKIKLIAMSLLSYLYLK